MRLHRPTSFYFSCQPPILIFYVEKEDKIHTHHQFISGPRPDWHLRLAMADILESSFTDPALYESTWFWVPTVLSRCFKKGADPLLDAVFFSQASIVGTIHW